MSLPSGPVGIFAQSSQKFSNGRDIAGQGVQLTQAGSPNGNPHLTWQAIQLGDDKVAFRSFSSGGFLDGTKGNYTQAVVTNGDPHSDTGLQWRIIHTGNEEWVVVENVKSKGYLDGRSYENDLRVTNRPWQGDKYFPFKFVQSAL